jgi:predicted ArsR family transcriptional regulator
MRSERTAAIASVAALDDPQRRRLYDAIRNARRPMTREEAAREVDISRKLAAFHLDKLVALGLLELVDLPASVRRSVGRTPKRYQPSDGVVEVTIPDRSYDALAGVLIDVALETDDVETARVRARVAADHGRAIGESMAGRFAAVPASATELEQLEVVLDEQGFEPYPSDPGALRLHNCPFHPFAARATELVCGMNLHYLQGMIDGIGGESVSAVLAPRPGECCVEIRALS